ncbi:hypothetical protein [Bartonella mastomydis]|nr:hypothetical protein [Bartonella mastomydis]
MGIQNYVLREKVLSFISDMSVGDRDWMFIDMKKTGKERAL